MKKWMMCLMAICALSGCTTTPIVSDVRWIGTPPAHQSFVITTPNIWQADYLRKTLPEYLGINKGDMTISPGSGYTKVRIYRISEGGSRSNIEQKIRTMRENNPKITPIQVEFR